MLELIKTIFDKACEQKTIVQLNIEGDLFTSYHDLSGQRQSYLTFYHPKGKNQLIPIYVLRRHCTFISKGDEGKEDAVLATINLNCIKDKAKLTVSSDSNTFVKINNLTFYFDDKLV